MNVKRHDPRPSAFIHRAKRFLGLKPSPAREVVRSNRRCGSVQAEDALDPRFIGVERSNLKRE